MDDKILTNIANLIDKRNINKIIIESITELQLNRKSIWQYVVSFIIGSIVAYMVAFNYGTVQVMTEVSGLLFNTSIVIIGVILAAYSIFQTLMQKELILTLIQSENNLLEISNKSFLNLIILHVINAVTSLTLKIILSAIGKEFLVFDKMIINNILSAILILVYMFFNLLLLLELIVFATNLYRMFCVYNSINALSIIQNDEEI